MTANEKFTVCIYDGDYGLPSLNVECLKMLLYASIAKLPLQTKTLDKLKHCILYKAPSFGHKNLYFGSFSEMVLYLNTLNYNLDASLSPKQRSESLAITNLVQSKLRATVEFVFWLDQRNFEELTRIWFSKALPLPFNLIHTKYLKENAVNLIESIYPVDYNMEAVKDNLTSLTTECLSSLSARLGTSSFFFGDNPTTLDVVVYSYVAPLLRIPFPSNSISSLVALWPNIVSFVNRIDAKYFPDVSKELKYLKDEATTKTSDDDVSYVAISILTVSAMTLVFGFAVSKGFIAPKFF